MLLEDGRVGLLDWGQTKVLPPDKIDLRGVRVCMTRRRRGLAQTIESSGIAELGLGGALGVDLVHVF